MATQTPGTIRSITVTLPDGTKTVVQIAAFNGWASIKELTEIGAPHYQHLERVRIQRHEGKSGYRWCGSYKLPETDGGGEIPVRHHQNSQDDRRGLNRAETCGPSRKGAGRKPSFSRSVA
jgi:hypothetical protein